MHNPKARRKHNNKIFQGKGGESDPCLALKKYLSHRLVPREDSLYKKLPLKRDGLANIMKKMVEKVEIQKERNFTNSSGRKTAI